MANFTVSQSYIAIARYNIEADSLADAVAKFDAHHPGVVHLMDDEPQSTENEWWYDSDGNELTTQAEAIKATL